MVFGWTVCALAQTDPGRDLSKYADDKFRDDDKYQVAEPYETVTVRQPKSKKVKNVIVMIGDGMGLEQISVGWTLNGGHLNLDNFPVAGYSRTWCTDRLITDSCAGGTAISSGAKTKYGYIGQDPDGNPFVTLLHRAQQKGMRTGLAVTCRINDATPADFDGPEPRSPGGGRGGRGRARRDLLRPVLHLGPQGPVPGPEYGRCGGGCV